MFLMIQQRLKHHPHVHPHPSIRELLIWLKNRHQRRRLQVKHSQLIRGRHRDPPRIRGRNAQPVSKKRDRLPHYRLCGQPWVKVLVQWHQRLAGLGYHVPYRSGTGTKPLPPVTSVPGKQQNPHPALIPPGCLQQVLQPCPPFA
jgi:hypothetical protein